MSEIKNLSVTNLRMLGLDQIVKNATGHPGIVLSAAPLIHEIYLNHLQANIQAENWINRDRFVLSAGHGSALLYAQLHLAGFNLSIADLKQFRQIDSITAGHPEIHLTPGVDISTGPLGQGLAMAVGLAISEKHLRAKYNRQDLPLFNHYTYVICGDADLEEGVTQEAIQLAGVNQLERLIVLYDSNDVQLDSKVEKVQTTKYQGWFEDNDWEYILVKNGNDLAAINQAIKKAKLSSKPTLIECKTIIGLGHPKQGTPAMHGNAFNEEEMTLVKKAHQWEHAEFTVLDEVKKLWQEKFIERGKKKYAEWKIIAQKYQEQCPTEWNELFGVKKINVHQFQELLHDKKEATRNSSQKVFQKLQELDQTMLGGSADLVAATKIQGYAGDFSLQNPAGNNILFGVREFAMGAIVNGITLYGCLKGFGSTFVVFSDYMKNAIRMAALQKAPTLFLLTHDSIAAGYDGPTHQPVEQIVGFRATPNLLTFRPADLKETIGAYVYAYNQTKTPSILLFCRQDVEQYPNTCWEKTQFGAYIVHAEDQSKALDAIIIATGSELGYALEYVHSSPSNVRVVSMPSNNLFDQQSAEYQSQILPKTFKKVITIEAANELSWYKYAGKEGLIIAVNNFGASGPGNDVLAKQGFSQKAINEKINQYLNLKVLVQANV